ncbi:MAG: sulfite exporter TauE/SafE family protein [Oscillospiraceae bacterium]|nr:sulfite exporter TauE/SafE family protein [Oscillospiraceae bacterium]
MKKSVIHVTGMTCRNCECRVEGAVSAIEGVSSATADCGKGQLTVEYSSPCTEAKIKAAIEETGYGVSETGKKLGDTVAILVIILALYVIARHMGWLEIFQNIPIIGEEQMSYFALFLIGLLTSVHCIAMCGGLNLAQSISEGNTKPLKRSVLYNLGRLTSYTIIGGVLGFIGEKAAITLQVRGIIGLIAGVFMLIMGIRMLGGFQFRIRLFPKLSAKISQKIQRIGRHSSFAVGLANGFMPCGPLQSMQIYAIASGSMIAGALSMFSFCLGTIPLVFVFGMAAGMLKSHWRTRMLQVGSVLLIVMGIFMLQNNLVLTGFTTTSSTTSGSDDVIVSTVDGDVQYVTTALHSNGYDDIQVTAGIPVVWTIEVDESSLNGCNNEIVLSAFNQQVKLTTGEVVIEFTPVEEGTYTYSCWMGMLKNTITVVEE